MKTTLSNNKGFTLVELLVVMAICTLLLAVALPVTMQARNRARSAKCIANLHELGGAVMLYTQDWGDRLPKLSANAFAGSEPTKDWPQGTSATEARADVMKLAGSGKLFRCPNDVGADEYGFSDPDKPVFDCTGSSYVPWSSARTGSYGVGVNGAILSAIANPRSQILFRDYGSDWHGTRLRDGLSVNSMEQTNAVYADGHAAPSQVFVSRSPRGQYSWVVSRCGPRSGIIRLDGMVASQQVELTGRYASSDTNAGYRVALSGLARCGGLPYEVDRVFNVGNTPDAGMHEVLAWIESLDN